MHDLAPIVSAWCVRWGVKSASLFGSAARGELTDDSDIDIFIVEGHKYRDGASIKARRAELEAALGRPVELAYRGWIERMPDFDPDRLGPVVELYRDNKPRAGPWRPRRRWLGESVAWLAKRLRIAPCAACGVRRARWNAHPSAIVGDLWRMLTRRPLPVAPRTIRTRRQCGCKGTP